MEPSLSQAAERREKIRELVSKIREEERNERKEGTLQKTASSEKVDSSDKSKRKFIKVCVN